MPDLLITEAVTGPAIEVLKKEFDVAYSPDLWKSPDGLRAAVADCRAILVRNQTRVTAELLKAAPKLELVGRAGVGLDNVDTHAASELGICVAFTPEQNSLSVAELTLGMMLSLARMIPAADRSTKGGKWERQRFTGTELFGKTLGTVGLGRIGFLVATRARAFGMNIVAHDNFISSDSPMVVESRARLVPIDELLEQSDFVSCHLPKTPQTVNFFNAERFARMKPTAYFLNTSRGEVVDEAALLEALSARRIAGAALDVRAVEPAPPSQFNELDNVILTPHVAAFTHEGQGRVVAAIARDIAAVLRGGDATNYVNFPRPKRGARQG